MRKIKKEELSEIGRSWVGMMTKCIMGSWQRKKSTLMGKKKKLTNPNEVCGGTGRVIALLTS